MPPRLLLALTSLAMTSPLIADPVPDSRDITALADYFFRRPLYEEVRVSPDGDAVAYTFNEGDDSGIRFVQFSTGKVYNLENSERVFVREFEWVDEDRLIYIIQATGQSHPQVNTITLERFKPDEVIPAGERHRRRSGGLTIVDALPSVKDKVLAWRGEQAGSELILLNTRNDQTPIVADNDGSIAEWFNDETGALWMAARRNKENGRADIFVRYDSARKAFHELESLRGSRTEVVSFLESGKQALIIADVGGDTSGLVQFDLGRDETVGDMLRDSRFDFSDPQPLYVPHFKAVVGVHVDLNSPRTFWFNPQLEQFQKLIGASMPEGRYNEVVAFHPDGVTVFVRSYSDTFPGELVKIDLKARKIEPVLRQRPWIDDDAMSPSRLIGIPTADGQPVYAFLTLPRGQKRNLPLLIDLSIGPENRAYHEFDEQAQFYAAQGYAYLLLMPRGSTGFGKTYLGGDESPRAFMASHVADDAAAAAQWAIGEGIARAGAIGLIGDNQFGGFSALSCAVRYPNLFKAIASSARTFELKEVLHRRWDTRLLKDDAFLRAHSVMDRIEDARASFLLLNFRSREGVSAAEKLERALKAAGRNVVREEFPNDFKRRDLPQERAVKYAAFMREHLKED